MKRCFSVICVLVLLSFLCVSTAFAGGHTVTLTVDFEKNLIFSTYDVEVYLDSSRVGSYKHGENFNVSFTADDGDHTIWFYEDGNKSNKGSIDFKLTSDTSISCHIECKNNKVKVSKVNIDRGGSSEGILDLSGSTRSVTTEETQADDPNRNDIGKTQITNDGVSFTLLEVKESKGDSFMPPDSGKIYILVQFLIENNSKDEVNISSVMTFDAYCDGFSCDYSFGALMAVDDQLDGSIAAGKKMKGWIGYEVDKNWKELEVHVQPSLWSSEKMVFITHKK